MSHRWHTLILVAVAGLLTGTAGELTAADHQESPILAGSYFLSLDDAVIMDRFLETLGAEPVHPSDGPMPQTKEHILLARRVVPSSRASDVEYLQLPFADRELVELLLEEMHASPRDFRQFDFLVEYSCIRAFPSEGR